MLAMKFCRCSFLGWGTCLLILVSWEFISWKCKPLSDAFYKICGMIIWLFSVSLFIGG